MKLELKKRSLRILTEAEAAGVAAGVLTDSTCAGQGTCPGGMGCTGTECGPTYDPECMSPTYATCGGCSPPTTYEYCPTNYCPTNDGCS